jgi:hypothetical protein
MQLFGSDVCCGVMTTGLLGLSVRFVKVWRCCSELIGDICMPVMADAFEYLTLTLGLGWLAVFGYTAGMDALSTSHQFWAGIRRHQENSMQAPEYSRYCRTKSYIRLYQLAYSAYAASA